MIAVSLNVACAPPALYNASSHAHCSCCLVLLPPAVLAGCALVSSSPCPSSLLLLLCSSTPLRWRDCSNRSPLYAGTTTAGSGTPPSPLRRRSVATPLPPRRAQQQQKRQPAFNSLSGEQSHIIFRHQLPTAPVSPCSAAVVRHRGLWSRRGDCVFQSALLPCTAERDDHACSSSLHPSIPFLLAHPHLHRRPGAARAPARHQGRRCVHA